MSKTLIHEKISEEANKYNLKRNKMTYVLDLKKEGCV
jgi:hypothetical protein